MKKNVSKDTIARTIVLAVALVNQVLTILGLNPLPFSDNQIYEAITAVFTVIASVIAWWKNNSFTQAALKGDEVMNEEKAKVNNVEEKKEETSKEV